MNTFKTTVLIQRDDLLYYAGLLDGDGSLVVQMVRRSDYVFQYQLRFTVQVTQLTKRKHHLEEMKNIIGYGYIRDRSTGISDYILTETRCVYSFLKQIAPFLRIKKKQANLIIRMIEQLPSSKKSAALFIELCQMADQVAELNDSKSRKITADVVANDLKKLKVI
jgi:intein-encoded DNA endonuclease-like protein